MGKTKDGREKLLITDLAQSYTHLSLSLSLQNLRSDQNLKQANSSESEEA